MTNAYMSPETLDWVTYLNWGPPATEECAVLLFMYQAHSNKFGR